MKILNLKTENVQRVKLIEIAPGDNNLVIVGGNNGQGKTSLLDSVMFALGGKRALSQKPVREGATTGVVDITTEDLRIKRTIKPSGESVLEVTSTDGSSVSSPQKLFERLTSKLTFDPLAFAEMEPKDQIDILKGLISYDFSRNEALRKKAYDERTFVNRELKQKQAENEANPFDPSFPVDEVSFDLGALTAISQEEIAKQTLQSNVDRTKVKIAETQEELRALNDKLVTMETWLKANEPKLEAFGNLDERVAQAKAENASAHDKNVRIRKNADAKKIYLEVDRIKAHAEQLSRDIEALDAEKMSAIEAATLPVSGLTFADDVGVLFGGIPFAQLSGAERLKVSLAMGIALNPELRVLLIRDGSLLDSENLRVVAEMAQAHDMQVWIERVGKGEECSVIIEDGTVLENRIAEQQGVSV